MKYIFLVFALLPFVAMAKLNTCEHVFLAIDSYRKSILEDKTNVKNKDMLRILNLEPQSLKNKTILELGPGSGNFIEYAVKHLLASKDSMSVDLRASASKHKHLIADIKQIDLDMITRFLDKDSDFSGFDLIVSTNSIGEPNMGSLSVVSPIVNFLFEKSQPEDVVSSLVNLTHPKGKIVFSTAIGVEDVKSALSELKKKGKIGSFSVEKKGRLRTGLWNTSIPHPLFSFSEQTVFTITKPLRTRSTSKEKSFFHERLLENSLGLQPNQ